MKGNFVDQIFYVCGSDNAKFVRAFKNDGGCICVVRENYAYSDIAQEDEIAHNHRIIFTKHFQDNYARYSSTSARKWSGHFMPDEVSAAYFTWRKNSLIPTDSIRIPRKTYILRDEGIWAIDDWVQKLGRARAMIAHNRLRMSLEKLLQDTFLYARKPDMPLHVGIKILHLKNQKQYIKQLEKIERLLNLDICTNDNGGVNVSREFNLADGQLFSHKLTSRPGFPGIETQIHDIVPGKYTLLDDDVATGSTINMLMGALPESIQITKLRTLVSSLMQQRGRKSKLLNQEILDVADLRDFIVGSRASGLVVRLPNGDKARAPYMHPYVTLFTRASIPLSGEREFSKQLWLLNLQFFNEITRGEKQITLEDFDEYVRKLFLYLGFDRKMKAADLCRWHIENLYYRLD